MPITIVDDPGWDDMKKPAGSDMITAAGMSDMMQRAANRDALLKGGIPGLASSLYLEVPLTPLSVPTKWERFDPNANYFPALRQNASTTSDNEELVFHAPLPFSGGVALTATVLGAVALVRFASTSPPEWPRALMPKLEIFAYQYGIGGTSMTLLGSVAVSDTSANATAFEKYHNIWAPLDTPMSLGSDRTVVVKVAAGSTGTTDSPGFSLYRLALLLGDAS